MTQKESGAKGGRDIAATLYATRSAGFEGREAAQFESLLSSGQSAKLTQYRMSDEGQESNLVDSGLRALGAKRAARAVTPNPVIILTAVCCVLALMLPVSVTDDQPSYLPSYLHLSLPQKLIAAYVLGLVTMVIFKP
jgi:hypothetical protein